MRFNVGSYKEMALQAAKNTEDGLPWLLAADYKLLVIVDQGSKRLSCLAEVAADLARSSGCTELSVTDHDVVRRVEARQRPLDFPVMPPRIELVKFLAPLAGWRSRSLPL